VVIGRMKRLMQVADQMQDDFSARSRSPAGV
jgi:hypothetical protein